MAYNKTNWKSGDVVTSEKLNKMENGIVDAGKGLSIIVAHYNGDTQSLDITPNDIFDDNNNAIAWPVVLSINNGEIYLDSVNTVCRFETGFYGIEISNAISNMMVHAERNQNFELDQI